MNIFGEFSWKQFFRRKNVKQLDAFARSFVFNYELFKKYERKEAQQYEKYYHIFYTTNICIFLK